LLRYLAHLVDAAALLSAQEGLDAIIQRVLLRLRRQLLNMNREERKWKKVAGIGGLFFRARDPKALGSWYPQHLGIELTPTSEGAPVWQQEAGPAVFGPFPEKGVSESEGDFASSENVSLLLTSGWPTIHQSLTQHCECCLDVTTAISKTSTWGLVERRRGMGNRQPVWWRFSRTIRIEAT